MAIASCTKLESAAICLLSPSTYAHERYVCCLSNAPAAHVFAYTHTHTHTLYTYIFIDIYYTHTHTNTHTHTHTP